MNLFSVIALSFFVTNLLLGIYLFFNVRQGKIRDGIVTALVFFISAWSLIDFFFIGSDSIGRAFILEGMSSAFSLICFTLFFDFSLNFSQEGGLIKKKYRILLYIPAIVLIALRFFSTWITKSVIKQYWGYEIETGSFYWAIPLYILILSFLSLLTSIRYHALEKKEQILRQFEYVMIASSLAIMGLFMVGGIILSIDVTVIPLILVVASIATWVVVYSVVRSQMPESFIPLVVLTKIRNKISIPMIAVISVMFFLLGSIVYIFFRNVIDQEIARQFGTSVELKANRVETFFSGEREIAEIIAKDHHFSDQLKELMGESAQTMESYEDLHKHRQEVLDNFKRNEIYEIDVLNLNGNVTMSTDSNVVGMDRNEEQYFIHGKEGFYIGKSFDVSGREFGVIPISTPIRDSRTERVIGVLVAMTDKKELSNILTDRTGMGETGETYLVDADYQKITPTRFSTIDNSNMVETQNAQDCFSHRGSAQAIDIHAVKYEILSRSTGYAGNYILGTHYYIPDLDWCVLAEVSETEALASLNSLLRLLLLMIFISIIFAYVIIRWISKKITKPIEELRRGVELIEKGNREYDVTIDSKDEIGELSRAFDKMTESLARSDYLSDQKVKEQTKNILEQKKRIEEQQRATLNILEDVENEKDRSEKLASDLEKFKLAVDNASDYIIITDPDGIIIYVNEAVSEGTGFSDKEMIGSKFASRNELGGGLMEKSFYNELWRRVKVEKETFLGEAIRKRKDGTKYNVAISASPVLDGFGNIIFVVAIERDVTKEKEIDKAKTEFVSLASHQLRTPLSAVNWYAEMLLSGDAGKMTQKQKKYIDEIYDGNQRMVELVNALLNVSRIELGTFSIEPKPSDITEIFENSISELNQRIKEKKLNVIRNFEENMGKMDLDANLMGIIFQNLLSNSVKYTPEEGTIEVSINKRKNDVLIEISDSGYGIPKSQQGRIFEKLFRADNVRERETDGTGLGLYIVKAIVKEAGGEIWFSSEENKGTTFFISIPIVGMKEKKGAKGLSPA